ncbi:MAG: hypothetical protein ACLTX6_10710 [Lachnospiraceae bacterium]
MCVCIRTLGYEELKDQGYSEFVLKVFSIIMRIMTEPDIRIISLEIRSPLEPGS